MRRPRIMVLAPCALAFLLACGGARDDSQPALGPHGWHPVGTPVELPSHVAEVEVLNDSLESVYAIHLSTRAGLTGIECSELVLDDCVVRSCVRDLAALTEARFGQITVSVGGQELVFSQGGANYGPAPLWVGTAKVGVEATDADVPAFAATLIGPAAVETLAPIFPPFGEHLEVDWDAPLELKWGGGQPGQRVVATLTWSEVDHTSMQMSYSTEIVCSFAAEPGSGAIPPEAFREVPREGVWGPVLELFTHEYVVLTVDAYAITVAVSSPGRSADGQVAYGRVKPL